MNNADSGDLVRKLIVQSLIWLALTAAILFASAGTFDWPEAWVYLALWLACGWTSGLSLAKTNPDIMRERMRSPIQREQKGWDRPLIIAIFAAMFALLIAAGIDARFRLSDMPLWLEVAGALAMVVAVCLFHIVMRENTYASTAVKVDTERGHKLIDTGPYAWVRHPMYAGTVLYLPGTALLLGSWWALGVAILLIAIIALRAVWEEQTLIAELPGYAEYAQRVRYRLVPGVW